MLAETHSVACMGPEESSLFVHSRWLHISSPVSIGSGRWRLEVELQS
jgi:hypothetical protein